jgi:Cu/Zn superoxide dismutase
MFHGRIRRTLITGLVLVAATSLFAAACAEDEPEEDGDATSVTGTSTSVATMAPTSSATEEATATATEDGGETVLAADVAGVDSDVAGTVEITVTDGSAEVVVNLTDLPEGAHANHIHVGSCDEQGDVVYPLTELEAGTDGTATGETTVDVTADELLEGHYYAVHEAGDDTVGAVIGCGDIVEG